MAHWSNICGSPFPTAKRRPHFQYLSTVKSWPSHGEILSLSIAYPWFTVPFGRMSSPAEAACCIICLDSDPPPIQSGCACRSDSGLAHLDCLIEKAVSQQAHRGNKVWWECQTCGEEFTGAMRTGLGEAWWSRVCDEAEESAERLCAAHNLASCRHYDGRFAESERIEREVLGVRRRVLGEEHPDTLSAAGNLAQSLSRQGKYADAERIGR